METIFSLKLVNYLFVLTDDSWYKHNILHVLFRLTKRGCMVPKLCGCFLVGSKNSGGNILVLMFLVQSK